MLVKVSLILFATRYHSPGSEIVSESSSQFGQKIYYLSKNGLTIVHKVDLTKPKINKTSVLSH